MPQPVSKPIVARDLPSLPPIERATEVLRYSMRDAEWWISPGGHLRAWIRLNLLVSLSLGIPALLIVPVVTYFLNGVLIWTALLVQIGKNLVIVPVLAMAGVALVTGIFILLRIVLALAGKR